MLSIIIHDYHCERLSEKEERLVLNAIVRGVPRDIVVNIGRYEKRPVFMIHGCGELCNYEAKAMASLLNEVVMAYAATQDGMNFSEII